MEYTISNNVTAVTRGIQTLNTAQTGQVASIATLARQQATNARMACIQALTLIRTPGHDAFDLGPNFLQAFRSYFAISMADLNALIEPTLVYVIRQFARIDNGLQGPLVLVDVDTGTQISNAFHKLTGIGPGLTAGYLRGAGVVRTQSRAEAPGRIHFDFGRLAQQANMARTVVHEASHKFCGTKDHAYNPSWHTLSPVQAKNNADSYAYFAATPGLSHSN